MCVLAMYFSPIYENTPVFRRNGRSHYKYFYRVAKLAMIHVNDLGVRDRISLLVAQRCHLLFLISLITPPSFFFLPRTFNRYAISLPWSVKSNLSAEKGIRWYRHTFRRVLVQREERNSNGCVISPLGTHSRIYLIQELRAADFVVFRRSTSISQEIIVRHVLQLTRLTFITRQISRFFHFSRQIKRVSLFFAAVNEC